MKPPEESVKVEESVTLSIQGIPRSTFEEFKEFAVNRGAKKSWSFAIRLLLDAYKEKELIEQYCLSLNNNLTARLDAFDLRLQSLENKKETPKSRFPVTLGARNEEVDKSE